MAGKPEKKGMLLADMLGDLPVFESNTGEKQIEYLPLHELHEDPDNFYSMDGIEDLAANIATVGLLDPIVVYRHGEEWRVLSGHRRRAALLLLAKEEPEKYLRVPCIVDRAEASPELRELQLIMANSGTRKMTGADMATQVDRTYDLLYRLQQQGYSFPGKMRAHVAEACQISESRIAKLNAIRNGLAPWIHREYYNVKDPIDESLAYELSKLPQKLQTQIVEYHNEHSSFADKSRLAGLYVRTVSEVGRRVALLEKMECDVQKGACNRERKTSHIIATVCKHDGWYTTYCENRCCEDCPEFIQCHDVCDLLKSEQQKRKTTERIKKADEKAAAAAKARPAVEEIMEIYRRFSERLTACGVSVKDFKYELDIDYADYDEGLIAKRRKGEKVTPETIIPYGYGLRLTDVHRFCRAAELLECSVDYLLGRADDLPGDAAGTPGGQLMISGWMPGGTNPGHSCQCAVDFSFEGDGPEVRMIVDWNAIMGRWEFPDGVAIEAVPVRWTELPEVADDG